ncbi:germination protein, Ger(x)C family [Paenibacillus sp. UNC496MF]|uniref:Ger(x)C family spore germination protein n=1 Tax=Paenibacillus sp. UNC496MF TaxID=1502753 RepID=UPI0008EEBD54|nr:Ger(x)C family spore germination protein [Paenibacillus sp. UNC496MF]SFI78013.1 germination protein, Ger(x)C family [Paenibacillus sp. UNC496MF]
MNRRWSKLVKLSAALSMLVPLLTGCWDRLEIEDRAVVLGVSIDKAKGNSDNDEVTHHSNTMPAPKMGLIRVAVQIALPGRIPLGPGEGGGGTTDPQQTVWVINVVGFTLDDAFMKLQQQVSSRIFLGHLRVIIMSEEYAKGGIDNVNDFFRRNSEVRRMAWLMVSKGSALALLKAGPKLERIPTLYLMSALDEGINMGKFPRDYIGIFWSNSSKKGEEGYLPYVALRKEQNVEIMGLAYFQGSRMMGKTKPLQIGSFMAIKGSNPAGYRVYVMLEGTKKMVMTTTTHRNTKWKASIKDGKTHFSIKIVLEVNIEEKMSRSFNLNNAGIVRQIQDIEARKAEKFCAQLIRQTQTAGSDIFGFGEYIRAKKPSYWNANIKTKEKWQEAYKEMTFDIHAFVNVRRVGMKAT